MVTPANRPEEEAAAELQRDIELQNLRIAELHIDRGYISAPTVDRVLNAGGDILCKPWVARSSNALFTKNDFHVDMRRLTITCPAGEQPGTVFRAVVLVDGALVSNATAEYFLVRRSARGAEPPSAHSEQSRSDGAHRPDPEPA